MGECRAEALFDPGFDPSEPRLEAKSARSRAICSLPALNGLSPFGLKSSKTTH